MLALMNVTAETAIRPLLRLRSRSFEVQGHRVYLSDHKSPSLAFTAGLIRGNYEPEIEALYPKIIREGDVVVDIGAHVGVHALLAARLVGPRGRIYAFEPDPDNYRILQKNIAANGYTNITAANQAVSDRSGAGLLFRSGQGNDRHSMFRNPRSVLQQEGTAVRTTTLDDFLEAEGWPAVRLVKMDIEGAEPLALSGMNRLLERSAELAMLVEFAPESLMAAGHSPPEVLRLLAEAGFEIGRVRANGDVQRIPATSFASYSREIEDKGVENLLCRKSGVP